MAFRARVLSLAVSVAALAACGDEPADRLRAERGAAERRAPVTEAARAVEAIRRDGNHLLGQPSPYLAQHAHNPVDWYPWGPEALARARRENKPIFLSIGYSTCHWCHVMEHESFEDDEVAAYLNAHFVSIKVDREQRPDVDALYLEAVRRMGGSTGWPLTVFLTPSLVPYFGGTYFPRTGGMGRPGFLDVLRQVAGRWDSEGDAVAERGRQIFAQIEADARAVAGGSGEVSPTTLDAAMRTLARARDMELGGFGGRQKFPNAPLLLAELRHVRRTSDTNVRDHLVLTLEEAMRGGIRDHLAGSFHRYTVDRQWHVPHFEKTLYDNAQLAQLYVEAGRALGREDFVAVGRSVLDDLIAEWQRDDGGFVVGFDADDAGGEGFYYTWTPRELEAAIGAEDAPRFAALFGVSERGEPLLEDRSVLHRVPPGAARAMLRMEPADVDAFLARARPALLEARARRRAPATDDKELAGWNGLAIMALADVGRWLGEPRYLAAAARAARFVLDRCWDEEHGVMLRGRRQGESLGEGFLDDYAIPLLGLLRLHAADGDPRWLLGAHAIGRAILERFYDPELSTFHHTARADVPEGLPLRRPDLDDGVMPSGANAAALALRELGAMAGDRALLEAAQRALEAHAPRATSDPFASGFLLVALDHVVGGSREVVIAGEPGDPRTEALFAVVRGTTAARVLPIRVPAAGASEALVARYPALRAKVAIDGVPTAYVCEIGRCELPATQPAVLRAQLDAARAL